MVIEKQQPLTQWSGRLQSASLAQGCLVQVLVPASSGRENDWTPTWSSQVLPVPEGLEHSPLVSVAGPQVPVEVPGPTVCSITWETLTRFLPRACLLKQPCSRGSHTTPPHYHLNKNPKTILFRRPNHSVARSRGCTRRAGEVRNAAHAALVVCGVPDRFRAIQL